jgi:outer membrane lipoprotein carrier protein
MKALAFWCSKLLLGLAVVWSSLVWASADGEQLNGLLSTVRSMQANFNQQLVRTKGKSESYSGRFSISRPGKFRWTITSPDPQLLIADGKNLWVYDEGLQQVTVQPLNSTLGTTPALLLSGQVASLEKTFLVKKIADDGSSVTFQLTPRKQDAVIQNIALVFQNSVIKKMVLTGATGEKSTLSFNAVRVNTDIDKKLFTFTPPKGVDVIGKPR